MAVLDTALHLTFLVCVSYAIITDFKTLLIPNWISMALIAAFFLFAVFHLPGSVVNGHLLVMGLVLVLSIAFFLAGWMGGGDVKLMSAIALWMGPDHVAPFVVLMALIGGGLATSILFVQKYGGFIRFQGFGSAIVNRLRDLAESRQCPYGVAIGLAGLLVSLQVFSRAHT